MARVRIDLRPFLPAVLVLILLALLLRLSPAFLVSPQPYHARFSALSFARQL